MGRCKIYFEQMENVVIKEMQYACGSVTVRLRAIYLFSSRFAISKIYLRILRGEKLKLLGENFYAREREKVSRKRIAHALNGV